MIESIPGGRRVIALLLMVALLALLATAHGNLAAADPDSGTVSLAAPSFTYTGGPYFTANLSPQTGAPVCNLALECDEFALTVDVPSGTDATHDLRITIGWDISAADFDVYLYDDSGTLVKDAASSSDPEIIVTPPQSGDYNLIVVPFAPLGQSFTGEIELIEKVEVEDPGPLPLDFPRYYNYQPPAGIGQSAGEPSIGVNHNTNAAMYIAVLETLRVHFDDDYSPGLADDPEVDAVVDHFTCSSPVKELWVDKSVPWHATTLDPILFTDSVTGLTLSSQLSAKTSLVGLSEDDGDTWLPSEGGSFVQSGVDHQTLGGGRYAEGGPLPLPGQIYTHAVYYCSQDAAYANCARSDDGGVTFPVAFQTHNLTQCGGLHGHVKVAPNDGTVHLPNKGCGGAQGTIVSKDNGITWQIKTVPDSVAASTDPAVGIASDGTVYFGYISGDSTPKVAVSRDHGDTWDSNTDVTANLNTMIRTAVFPVMVAGDPDRAAFAFLGTDRSGATSLSSDWTIEWYLYIAQTFDGGDTWHTINVTPGDPVQRGSICTGGTTCGGDRNLLDFNDIAVDREGRVLVGYADGCIGSCINSGPNTFSDLASIARQEGGKRLYAAFDPVEPSAPGPPRVDSVTQDASGRVTIEWTAANNGGSPITGYNIYRSKTGVNYTLIGSVSAERNRFVDVAAVPGDAFLYRVTATNFFDGVEHESVNCLNWPIGEAINTGNQRCVVPGVQVAVDGIGDQTVFGAGRDDADIVSMAVSEPYDSNDPQSNFVFTMEVVDLETATINNEYYFLFRFDGTNYFVSATSLNVATGDATYDYGTFAYDAANDNFIDTVVLGSADSGSFTSDGTIVIVLSKDKLDESGKSPTPGDTLTDFDARVYGNFTAVNTIGDRLAAPTGSFVVAGNIACAPNSAPVAALNVTPLEGESPLDVVIDASGSTDPDAGDTITEYRFNLGDGTPEVVTSSPSINHTYSHTFTDRVVEYRITVSVTDDRGKTSQNVAAQIIEVFPEGGIPTALATQSLSADGNRLGAFVGIVLITMLTSAVFAIVVIRKRTT